MRKIAVILALVLATGGLIAGQKKAPFTKAEVLTRLKQSPDLRTGQGDLAEEVTERGVSFTADEGSL